MFEEDEYRLTERPKEYFEWLKNHKNFPVDRYDIFMNKMKANGFKTSQLNPLFVAEMMGFPPDWTELPFLNGEKKV